MTKQYKNYLLREPIAMIRKHLSYYSCNYTPIASFRFEGRTFSVVSHGGYAEHANSLFLWESCSAIMQFKTAQDQHLIDNLRFYDMQRSLKYKRAIEFYLEQSSHAARIAVAQKYVEVLEQ